MAKKRGRPKGKKNSTKNPSIWPAPGLKRCTACKLALPIDQFFMRGARGESTPTIVSPDCRACNARRVVRFKWKKSLKQNGPDELVSIIAKTRALLEEYEEILKRWKSGEDVVNW